MLPRPGDLIFGTAFAKCTVHFTVIVLCTFILQRVLAIGLATVVQMVAFENNHRLVNSGGRCWEIIAAYFPCVGNWFKA